MFAMFLKGCKRYLNIRFSTNSGKLPLTAYKIGNVFICFRFLCLSLLNNGFVNKQIKNDARAAQDPSRKMRLEESVPKE